MPVRLVIHFLTVPKESGSWHSVKIQSRLHVVTCMYLYRCVIFICFLGRFLYAQLSCSMDGSPICFSVRLDYSCLGWELSSGICVSVNVDGFTNTSPSNAIRWSLGSEWLVTESVLQTEDRPSALRLGCFKQLTERAVCT